MDELTADAATKIGNEFGAAAQRAADAMTHFAKIWRASEAADELRRLGYSVPKP